MRSNRTAESVGRVTCCHHSHIWHANWNGMQNGYRRSIVRRQLAMHACTVRFRGTTGLVAMYAQQSYVRISRAGHLLSPFCHLTCKLEWHPEWVSQIGSKMSDCNASLHSSLSGYYGSGNYVCAAVVRENQSGGSPVVTILPFGMQT